LSEFFGGKVDLRGALDEPVEEFKTLVDELELGVFAICGGMLTLEVKEFFLKGVYLLFIGLYQGIVV
jgi:hypothetical protein